MRYDFPARVTRSSEFFPFPLEVIAMTHRVGLLLLALGVAVHAAQGRDDKKEQNALDPKVVDIVKQVGAIYKDAKSIHVDIGLTVIQDGENKKTEIKTTGSYHIERPNRLALRTKGGDNGKAGFEYVTDGKQVYIFQRPLNQYMTDEAPASLSDVAVALQQQRYSNTGILFQNVLTDDPAGALMDGVDSCSYAGTEKVGDANAHHLKFSQAQFNWEMWVPTEGKPFVLKIVTTRDADNGKNIVEERYSNWKIDAPAGKDAFTFTAPDGAKKVEQFDSGESGQ
jgi:hypothetical protein